MADPQQRGTHQAIETIHELTALHLAAAEASRAPSQDALPSDLSALLLLLPPHRLLPYLHRVLSLKPWKLESILRLFMRLFICMCCGWLLLAMQFGKTQGKHSHATLIILAGTAVILLGIAFVWLGKPFDMQSFFSRGVVLLIILYAGFVFTALVQHFAGPLPEKSSVMQMVVAMLSMQGAVLVLATLMLNQQGLSWASAFGLNNNLGHAILLGVIVGCLFLPIGYTLQRASGAVIERMTQKKPVEQQAVETIRDTPAPTPRLLLAIATIVLAPLGEETLFRGILYSTIKQIGYPRIAFWLSSIVFGLIHTNLGAFLPLVVLAMLLTWIYERTDNLLAPVIAHATFNAIEFTFMLIASPPT